MTPQAPQPRSLVDKAADFIDARRLVSPGDGIVVAVSGGADSVALLAVLRELAERPGRGYRLTVAHLDHALRCDSGADARFVADLAARWLLPHVVQRRDVAAEADRTGHGIEQAAREVRYAFLREVALGAHATRIATGHHADDNAETVLHRILRGTHLRGLAGIRPDRPVFGTGIRVVRPLLPFTREDLRAFCRERSLRWREDPTNVDTAMARNFIRRELLPLLRERVNPRVDAALLRLATAAAEAEAHLAAAADEALAAARQPAGEALLRFSVVSLVALDPVIRRHVMRRAAEALGLPMAGIGADRLAEMAALVDAPAGKAVALPGDCILRRAGDAVVFEPPPAAPRPPEPPIDLACPGRTALRDGRSVSCRIEPMDRAALAAHCADPAPGVELLDADTVQGDLLCRPRGGGDAFVPLGAPGRQTVSDFLTNRKLSSVERAAVRCICDAEGIVYLAPLRIADRVKVTRSTRRILRIELRGPPSQSTLYC